MAPGETPKRAPASRAASTSAGVREGARAHDAALDLGHRPDRVEGGGRAQRDLEDRQASGDEGTGEFGRVARIVDDEDRDHRGEGGRDRRSGGRRTSGVMGGCATG